MIEPLARHLQEGMLGHISEIADADLPHEPRGCAAQAWSVAELPRAVVEECYEVESRLKAALAHA